MKKKILTIALLAALAAVIVSGSLAYFTAEDKATNTFTIGSVKIEIYENGLATTSDTMPFGKLLPIVNTGSPSSDVNYIKKVVDVKNTGTSTAYIRTHIALPAVLADYLHLDVSTAGWSYLGSTSATVNGVTYQVYTYDYLSPVDANGFTTKLLQGVYLESNVDLEENSDGDLVFILRDGEGNCTQSSGFVAHTKNADGSYTSVTVNVLVASQAIQSQGFTSATAALNAGFGENTNPWQ